MDECITHSALHVRVGACCACSFHLTNNAFNQWIVLREVEGWSCREEKERERVRVREGGRERERGCEEGHNV